MYVNLFGTMVRAISCLTQLGIIIICIRRREEIHPRHVFLFLFMFMEILEITRMRMPIFGRT